MPYAIQTPPDLAGKEGPGTWILALFLAGLLNLVLFGLMPGLQSGGIGPEAAKPLPRRIQVVTLKRPLKTLPEKRSAQRPKPRKKAVANMKPSPVIPPSVEKLEMPFEINPRLPAMADTVTLPAMAHLPVGLPTPEPDAVFSMADLDQPLTPLVRVPPVYPLFAKKRGTEGWVRVGFLVTARGMVEDIRILEAQPEKVFDQSVIQCVSAWRFQPGTRNAKPVITRVETTIRFRLQ